MKCEICGSKDRLMPHLHYETHYKYPRFMAICKSCHTRIHSKGKTHVRDHKSQKGETQ